MGGSSSQPELPALPQQHIVNVSDGQAHPAPGIERQQIGTTKQAKAVRPGLSLLRGTLRLENSQLQVEVVANVAGAVELLMPCVETPGERPWPKISAAPTGAVVRRMSIAASGKSELSFDCAGISLASLRKVGNHHSTTWPAVLVLRPGETAGALAQQPPDGTTLAFCTVQGKGLTVVRQIIAWGGDGAAFEMQDMFGLQDARAGSAAGQQNCVVCLTAPRETALLPCNHFCVCYDCGISIRLNPSYAKCPLCRVDVKDLVRIDCAADGASEAAK